MTAIAAQLLHLSYWERSTREARRVRGYSLARVQNPLTPMGRGGASNTVRGIIHFRSVA